MLIKIIQGTYGHVEGGRVIRKDPSSEPFEVDTAQGERLIRLNVAEIFVEESEKPHEPNMQEDSNSENPTERFEYNETMTKQVLLDIAKKLNTEVKETMTKKEIIQSIDDFYNAQTTEDEGSEDVEEVETGEQPPSFAPNEPVQE